MWKRIDSTSVSVLVGILVSSIISIGIAVILMLNGQEAISAIIIALLVMIITILLDILFRVRFSETLLGEMLNIYEDPWLFKTVKEMIRGYRETIRRSKNEIILNRARNIMQVAARDLADLSNGHMTVNSPMAEREFLIIIIQTAKKNVRAVAHAEWFETWWQGPMAKNYLEENRRFIQERHGTITRILVIPREKLAESARFVRVQQDAGVHVLIAIREDQYPTLIQDGYVIVDEVIASKTTYSVNGTILGSRLTTNSIEIEDMKNNFEMLLVNSKDPKDFQELNSTHLDSAS